MVLAAGLTAVFVGVDGRADGNSPVVLPSCAPLLLLLPLPKPLLARLLTRPSAPFSPEPVPFPLVVKPVPMVSGLKPVALAEAPVPAELAMLLDAAVAREGLVELPEGTRLPAAAVKAAPADKDPLAAGVAEGGANIAAPPGGRGG